MSAALLAHEGPDERNPSYELGYSLLHAFGAMFDNPDFIACCGDGEAETGALATSWHSNKFLNPARDGAVLPIMHLNGYKIAGPTILARIGDEELASLFRGYDYEPVFVAGDEPAAMHRLMASTMDRALGDIHAIQSDAPANGFSERRRWPLIILRIPKGWTGPKTVDGKPIEGTFRSHQVPLAELASKPEHLKMLGAWMRSYRPEDSSTRPAGWCLSLPRSPPKAIGGWVRTRARQMGAFCSRTWRCRHSATMSWRWKRLAQRMRNPRARPAASCAT